MEQSMRRGGVAWGNTMRLFLVAGILLASLFLLGCSLEDAETNLEGIQKLSSSTTPYVPAEHTYIPAGISALATAALAVVRILKERRMTNRMKEAIKAKAKQVDILIASPGNPDPEKDNGIKKFLRADAANADAPTRAALADFDLARKGII